MKLRELADEILIDPRKLTAYALDPDNPKGLFWVLGLNCINTIQRVIRC